MSSSLIPHHLVASVRPGGNIQQAIRDAVTLSLLKETPVIFVLEGRAYTVDYAQILEAVIKSGKPVE